MLSRISRLSTNTINQLLYNIGSKNEVEWYLNHFSSADQFAIIKVGGGVLEESLEELSTALVFLQNVGLYPIVVHGSGPQMNLELERLQIKKEYHKGIRITDLETLKVAKRLFVKQNIKLCNAIEKLGTRTRPFYCGIFEAEYLDKNQYGYVGNITNVNKQLLKSAISHGALPILTSLAETEDGQTLNINADVAAVELAKALLPLKIVFINETGGMFDNNNNKINCINMDQEYAEYMKKDWVKYGTRLKLEQFKNLLETLPRSSSISITSAHQLQRELFTHKGAGTLIHRGYKIHQHDIKTVNMDLFKQSLSNYYMINNKSLSMTQFFGLLENATIYCDDAYECVIVLLPSPTPIIITWVSNKSAILHDIHELLFNKIVSQFPNLMWIINDNDPNKLWHFQQSKTTLKLNNEIILTRGTTDNNIVMEQYGEYRKTFAGGSIGKRNFSIYSRHAHSVGIVGGRGYTGQEIINILNHHPVNLTIVGSRQQGGVQYKSNLLPYTPVTPDNINNYDVDAWILCLPNNESDAYANKISSKHIIDMSADHRFVDDWEYGLPELHRSRYTKSDKNTATKRISNPGCYATAAQLGLAPIVSKINENAHCFGISGYSGAGVVKSKYNDLAHMQNNVVPYKVQNHIHEQEITKHLIKVQFTPHVMGNYRGIIMTIHVHLHGHSSTESLYKVFKQYYENEGLVRVTKEMPNLKDVENEHHVEIGGFSVNGDRGVVVVCLDNLLKGAATQCVQNLNLILGYPEYTGILGISK